MLIVPPRKMSFASLTSRFSLLSAGERLLLASASKSVTFSGLASFEGRYCLVTALWICVLVRSSYLLAMCPWGKSQSSKRCGMYPNELCLVNVAILWCLMACQ